MTMRCTKHLERAASRIELQKKKKAAAKAQDGGSSLINFPLCARGQSEALKGSGMDLGNPRAIINCALVLHPQSKQKRFFATSFLSFRSTTQIKLRKHSQQSILLWLPKTLMASWLPRYYSLFLWKQTPKVQGCVPWPISATNRREIWKTKGVKNHQCYYYLNQDKSHVFMTVAVLSLRASSGNSYNADICL